MVEYDAYYQEENYFGDPIKGIMDFFRNYGKRGKLLDIGCGQGRNALPLAEMGFEVTGIDISKVGLDQMIDKARRKNLSLRGILSDVYIYEYEKNYDVILLDSMIHFYKRDLKKESDLIVKMSDILKPGGILCFSLVKSEKNEKILKKIIGDQTGNWKLFYQTDLKYSFQDSSAYPYDFLVFEK